MRALFPATDDRDEQCFRIYGVVGQLHQETPRIALRPGIYGHFQELRLQGTCSSSRESKGEREELGKTISLGQGWAHNPKGFTFQHGERIHPAHCQKNSKAGSEG